MREPYTEGVATHSGPESCTFRGNAMSEALTGVYVGQVLSREIMNPGCRRRNGVGRQHVEVRQRKQRYGPARSETSACIESSVRENREIPRSAQCLWWASGRTGKAHAKAGDARTREVGQRHSTYEAVERVEGRGPGWMPWSTLNGHAGGNAGYGQGGA